MVLFLSKNFKMNTDPRIDTYIDKSQDFAKEILHEIRRRVHEFCPSVEETMKWSFPNFMYKGKILCSMASFKNHCSFGFWLAAHMQTSELKTGAMGDFGRMASLNDLPNEEIFKTMLFEAMELTDAGKTIPKAAKNSGELIESSDLLKSLAQNQKAQSKYNAFPPSHKKEYNQWILEAKTDVTRDRRITQAVEWISEGKGRNWKYEKC